MTNRSVIARLQTGPFAYTLQGAWQQFSSTLLDWIFPPTCVNCGRVDAQWCEVCTHELTHAQFEPFIADLPPFQGAIATGVHEAILQKAVQALKYHDVPQVAPLLAQRLAMALQSQEWKFDMIVPVPLHSTRFAQRGYNQAKLLSEALSKVVNVPVVDALQRERDTPSQVGLNRTERLTNVEGAFVAVSPGNVKSALLIDDVRTTGATLRACATALQEAGIPLVYAATVTVASF